MSKKKIRNLLFKEGGSVSIFSMVLILPIFMISALFIDSLRIMTASRELDEAMDSALRSTMSSYNKELADLGIFTSAHGTSPDGIFNNYLQQQIQYSADEFTNFSQLEINSGEASFDTSRNIIEPQVFDHNVAESMKYSAPIQFTSSSVEFLTELNGTDIEPFEDAVETADNYEELYELIKKRNAEIQKLIDDDKFIELKSTIIDSYKTNIIGSSVNKEDKIPDDSGLTTINHMHAYVDRYLELRKELKELEEAEDEEGLEEFEDDDKNEEINNFRLAALELTALHVPLREAVDSNMETLSDDIITGLFGSDGTFANPKDNSAMDYQNQINEMINTSTFEDLEFENLNDNFFKNIEDNLIDMTVKTTGDVVTESSNSTMLLAKFTEYASEMSLGVALENYTALDNFVNDTKNIKKDIDKLVTEIDGHYGNINTEIGKFNTHKESMVTSDGQTLDEAEDAREESEESLLETFNEIMTISEQLNHEIGIYNDVNDYYTSYGGVVGGAGLFEIGNPIKNIENFMNYLVDIFDFATGLPDSATNHMYINEFIFQTYAISEPYTLMDTESFGYDSKEGLYILYGNLIPGANYVNFLIQIFFIVLIFELVQNFTTYMKPPSIPNFILWVAFSIGEAAFAFEELLSNQNPNPSVTVTLGSKEFTIRFTDWYRFFLYTMFDKETKDLRTLAVVSEDKNIDFTEQGETYLVANVEAEVDILFIPAFFAISGNLNNDKFVLKKERHFSY